jgi:uncharacterized protein
MPASNGLRELHELHLKLKDVQDQLERGPRLIKAKENVLAKKQAELEHLKAQHVAQRKLADQKNLQLKSNEIKLADLNAKLNMSNSNREFDILKGQIAADMMANSVLEDEILDCLEQADRIKGQVANAEKAVADAKDEIRKTSEQAAAAEPGLKDRAATLRVALGAAETVLNDEVMLVYRRLVGAHGAESLATVENGVCTSCYVTLSPQQNVDLRTGKIMFCRSCGKLIYLKPADN